MKESGKKTQESYQPQMVYHSGQACSRELHDQSNHEAGKNTGILSIP